MAYNSISVECLTVNQDVGGSSPPGPAMQIIDSLMAELIGTQVKIVVETTMTDSLESDLFTFRTILYNRLRESIPAEFNLDYLIQLSDEDNKRVVDVRVVLIKSETF